MEKIRVWFCSVPGDALRERMADLCAERWMQEPGVDIEWISPATLGCTLREFQRVRRMVAEREAVEAGAEYYVVADDDCLLPADTGTWPYMWVGGFGVISLIPANAKIAPWAGGYLGGNVMEHVSVGGIRVCRTGCLEDWPPMGEGPGYDRIHADALRANGWRVGYYRHLKMLHLGEGYSGVWK